jgi:exopolysaccharide production protein ExoQ
LNTKVIHRPSASERRFAVALLLLSTGAFVNLYLQTGASIDPEAGLAFMQVIWVAIYAVLLRILIRESAITFGKVSDHWPLSLLLAFALLSVWWSDSPALTARHSLSLAASAIGGLYLAARYSLAGQLELLGTVFKISIVLSFLFGALKVGTAVDDLEGAWYGIYTQRNSLGAMMTLSVLVFLLWGRVQPAERRASRIWVALSVVLIFLSGSVTALISAGLLLLLVPVMSFIKTHPARARKVMAAGTLTAGLVVFLAASHLEPLFNAVGRDITFTGRTTIWGATVAEGADRFWLGSGFDAFWIGNKGASGEVQKIAGWAVPSAHNGFLEIWLALGVTGLAIFFLGFCICCSRSMQLFLRGHHGDAMWPLLFLILLVLLNLTQSALVSPNYIFWILYVGMSLKVCQLTKRAPGECAG